MADEILVTLRRCLVGKGEIPGHFLVADPDPIEHLLPAHALHEEIVADPVPEVRERDAARLHRAAKVFHRGVVPPGDGLDSAVEPVFGHAKPELLRDAELQPLEDQLVQRTAHQRVPAGQSGGRLPEVEDEVVEPSLDLAHENGVAVDHCRDAIELGGCARPRHEEEHERHGNRDAEGTGRARTHGNRFRSRRSEPVSEARDRKVARPIGAEVESGEPLQLQLQHDCAVVLGAVAWKVALPGHSHPPAAGVVLESRVESPSSCPHRARSARFRALASSGRDPDAPRG